MSRIKFLLIFYTSIVTTTSTNLKLKSSYNSYELEMCVENILNFYISKQDIVLNCNNDLKLKSTPIINVCDPADLAKKPTFYLLNLNNEIFFKINKFKSSLSSWNPRAKFIFFQKPNNKFKKFIELESFLKQNYITNFLIILNPNEFISWLEIDLTTIFTNQSLLMLQRIPNCDITEMQKTFFLKRKFSSFKFLVPRIVAVKYNPYVIDIKLENQPGIEIELFNFLGRFLNISIAYVDNPYSVWGQKFNGSYAQSLSFLQKGEGDIMIGMWYGNTTENTDFEGSTTYLSDSVGWFAPKARPIAPWLNMIFIFPLELWGFLLLTIITVATIWIYFEYSLHQSSPIYTAIIIWGTFFGNSQKNVKMIRPFLLVWLFFTLMVNSIYQSNLISILTSPIYEHQIEDVNDAHRSGMKFGYFGPLRPAILRGLTPTQRKFVLENEVVCPLTVECVNRTAFQRDMVIAKGKRVTQYLMPRYYRDPRTGKNMLQLFKNDEVFYYSIHVLMVKGYPLMERFNQILGRLKNGGIISKWSSNYDRVLRSEMSSSSSSTQSKLTIDHLGISFITLVVGLFLAIIVFILELMAKHYSSSGISKPTPFD